MNILIVTGERSAENYASLLVDELARLNKQYSFYSISSDILSKKTHKIGDYREISVIGIKEAFSITGKALRLLNETKRNITKLNIQAVILLDFPEFNMRISKFARKKNIKVIYYISPQVWAWREYRIKALFEHSDLIIPILPFEKTFFSIKAPDAHKVAYFGHPLVDLIQPPGQAAREKTILIMPGSRISEIRHNAPHMIEAARIINSRTNGYSFVWGIAPHIDISVAKNLLKGNTFIEINSDAKRLMATSRLGILKSGTTTLEAALYNLPMVVVYRLSRLSLLLGRILIKHIKHISLPNLIAGREIVPELIGKKATKETIAEEAIDILLNNDRYSIMSRALREVASVLGEPPVTKKIAEKIHETLSQ